MGLTRDRGEHDAPVRHTAALDWIYRRFFEHIEVDETWAKQVREAEARGTVIYVLRKREEVL